MFTLITFLLAARGNINSFAYCSYFVKFSVGFFNYFTRSAYLKIKKKKYLKVFIVFYDDKTFGETLPIITVLQNPTNESFNTIVSLLPLKGVCPLP